MTKGIGARNSIVEIRRQPGDGDINTNAGSFSFHSPDNMENAPHYRFLGGGGAGVSKAEDHDIMAPRTSGLFFLPER